MLALGIDLVFIGVHHLGWCWCFLDGLAHQFNRARIELIIVIQPTEVTGSDLLQCSVLRCGDATVGFSDHDDAWVMCVPIGETGQELLNILIRRAIVAHQ